ncbi:MAG TPA: NAD(P)/FAD-dependent oxidoreductase [Saprospiraceae bacterium]|nr:NAD(P)/FAD-dependent oxidoreductase [Saprospiraceae bacterium]HMP22580.1 NAD(P)/FAD-dependent oxidoreductase [Saprospiraceae bacterium]
MMQPNQPILIVGAGLVGTLWAIFLARRGYEVQVYERRSDMREAGIAGGRSINLAMSHRGWRALEKAGIKDTIASAAIPMYGRMMHNTSGELTFQAYGKEGQAIYSVSRGGLNLELLRLAECFPNVTLHFDQRCRRIDLERNEAHFVHTHTGAETALQAPLIFGADGAFSAVRSALQKTTGFNYSQQYLEYGYKELNIPPQPDGSHRMDKNALHIWPRGNFMLIALPNVDGSFTGTLFLPYAGSAHSFEALSTEAQQRAFFEREFPDVLPLMPDFADDFQQNPTGALVTIRCSPWHYRQRVLLLGDAAHAIVPFYGQGMNAGFEDCTLLDALIDQYNGDWPQIIENFNQTRIPDANAIADLALQNFVEMRDLVSDSQFLLRKKIEQHLAEQYPDRFLPAYSMVTFSHLPYRAALAEVHAQDRLFEQILALPDIEHNWQHNPALKDLALQG